MTSPIGFRLLNSEGDLLRHGWGGETKPRLWRYNQHYFDDLNAYAAEDRRQWHSDLLGQWVTDNPPASGVGWESYPTSLRIVNWVKWALANNALSDEVIHSLAVQSRWLRKRLEWHLLGNHLFANAKALVFAGLFFSGEEADAWLRTGVEILHEQLPEQVLDDGAQFELSPMYHALALEDLLDLVNVTRAYGRDNLAREFASRISAMLKWLLGMSHPDGDVAFFNDAAIGIAPGNAELLRYAQDLGFNLEPPADGITYHVQSGYLRMALGPAVVVADLARIGPDYLPGHAHADTLSFELSLYGKRFVVNSGTSVYGTGPERQRQRGTAAHSTLVVDDEDSSEVWSGFRVGRRAKPFDVAAYEDGTNLIAHGAHDGYTHLPGSPVHRRRWRLSEDRLFVEDTVEGFGAHQLEAYFHLGPGICTVAETANGIVELRDINSGHQATFSAEGGTVEVMPSSWHPEFGLSVATKVIRVSAEVSLPHTLRCELAWSAQ
ncbi:alginate lyase family protein [Altererythrobacter sp. BO-6]|uniref:heparinase II/III family protein n=1 Tax=Altererythrobacter sp. BO-6 TaxID=2604537 RepID=UPI0019D26D50|nr:alginate lyase family protein [Altererythrobacter sp. BO-6]